MASVIKGSFSVVEYIGKMYYKIPNESEYDGAHSCEKCCFHVNSACKVTEADCFTSNDCEFGSFFEQINL